MKYLLVLAVVGVALWFWRQGRRAERRARATRAPPPAQLPQPMVPCAHCGLHLPASEAVEGRRGRYCSAAHRTAAEG